MTRLTCITIAALILVSAPAAGQPNCGDPPDVLIVLDHSGSMTTVSGTLSNWGHAKAAVNNLATQYAVQIRFGLMLFPLHPNGGSCDGGQVNVQVGNNTQAAMSAVLNAASPTGLTPISVSLKNAHTYLQSIDPNKKKYVLLITDGQETCGGKPIDWVKALFGSNIETYVVGFGSGVDQTELNDLAKAGGTAAPGATSYYQADNPTQLNQALQAIGSLVSCCGNGVLDAGEKCDKTIPAGTTGACPTAADCDDKNPCTVDATSGADCNVVCTNTPITQPQNGDGCCPPGATSQNDSDCKPACGNGVLETGETCDPGIASGPGACKTLADCDDSDVCTKDELTGGPCDVQCKHTPVKPDPASKDGCCPPGSSLTEDADCLPKCNPDSTGPCVDLCKDVTCPAGQQCEEGKCVPLEPDGGLSGVDPKKKTNSGDGGAEPSEPKGAAGAGDNWDEGGGCACRAGPGPTVRSLFVPALLLLLGLALSRRS
jgi:MYXO-CTERM domain-containing protein